MCVRDGWPYLYEAVQSVLGQEHPVDRLVIVDDASTDEGVGYLASLSDPRVVVLRSEGHRGLAAGLRLGAQACEGDLIARLDADDVAEPWRIGVQVAYMESHPEAVMSCTSADLIEETGAPIGKYVMSEHPVVLAWQLLFRNPIVHSTAMFRAGAFREAGGYRPEMEPAEDYDLWSRLGRSGGTLGAIARSCVRLRKHGGQISERRQGQMLDAAASVAYSNIETLTGRAPEPQLVRILVGPRSGPPERARDAVDLLADVTRAHLARHPAGRAARREISARAIEMTREIVESNALDRRASRRAVRSCLSGAGYLGLSAGRSALTALRLIAPSAVSDVRRRSRQRGAS